jgi:holo-[acyl-carrier protein] synthase
MILGIGCDIVQIPRIEQALEEHGKAFEERLFSENERAYADRRGKAGSRLKASALAKRMAAKEAFVKALGTGFTGGISWKEIEVIHKDGGAPSLAITGKALAFLCKLHPQNALPEVQISLADDYPLAQAFVVISC